MDTIEAEFRVVTPLFMSGADQSRAELRLPSIKGVLRFWWRALAWERLGNDLKAVREQEAQLFGSTEAGQAGVLMRLQPGDYQVVPVPVGEVLRDDGNVVGEGARYLGYGVMEAFGSHSKNTREGELTRACIQAPFTFSLGLSFKRTVGDGAKETVLQALECLGLVGGMGSKARKGYGSLTLERLVRNGEVVWEAPATIEELTAKLWALIPSVDNGKPPFTAFSHGARIVLLPGGRDESALRLLNRVGRDLVFYRSWGRGGRVFGQPSEKNFEDDHDLMKAVESGASPSRHPQRAAFGLPHNYGRHSWQRVEPEGLDRRASPLFLHIHQPEGQPPTGALLFLPAQFLPPGRRISVGGHLVEVEQDSLWDPIHEFMDRVIDPAQGTEQFPGAREVQG